ncbi:MgtC/SapB family protein [Frigidibacter oleivorans]|uniref:MgtC/SapB family protein n=1 Tax=Frigidibacter oleivorans TaxID=2487129 RepID=UPI000F8CB718|nr:MgtC/SapB family protein [Frigidibacter oleivorans]
MWQTVLAELEGSFRATPPELMAVRIVAALLLGAAIGLERELHDKSAGLRTHILVAVGAAVFGLIGLELVALAGLQDGQQQLDTLRLIEAVTAGVAFLAAGSILRARGEVHGLTTGAGMWLAGAAGLACGVGLMGLALMATGITIVVLWLFKSLSNRIGRR